MAENAAGEVFGHLLIDDEFSAIHTQHIAGDPLSFRMTQKTNGFGNVFGRS